MGRVEKRMYRRRQKRTRLMRIIVLALLMVTAGVVVWRSLPDAFSIEKLVRQEDGSRQDLGKTETREVTLGEETWYAIQTGVFSTEEAARQKADTYRERGAPGTVIREGEKWRVFIACYPTEAEASSVRTRLEQNQRVDTYLYAWKCPELRLRMTGKTGQLDAVEAGFTLLLSVAAAMRDTATELDAAQLTTQEAAEAVRSLDDQITLWEQTLRGQFGRSLPEIAQDLLAISANWDERCAEILSAEGATALSASLKAHGMGMYDEIAAWRRAFAAK